MKLMYSVNIVAVYVCNSRISLTLLPCTYEMHAFLIHCCILLMKFMYFHDIGTVYLRIVRNSEHRTRLLMKLTYSVTVLLFTYEITYSYSMLSFTYEINVFCPHCCHLHLKFATLLPFTYETQIFRTHGRRLHTKCYYFVDIVAVYLWNSIISSPFAMFFCCIPSTLLPFTYEIHIFLIHCYRLRIQITFFVQIHAVYK